MRSFSQVHSANVLTIQLLTSQMINTHNEICSGAVKPQKYMILLADGLDPSAPIPVMDYTFIAGSLPFGNNTYDGDDTSMNEEEMSKFVANQIARTSASDYSMALVCDMDRVNALGRVHTPIESEYSLRSIQLRFLCGSI